ncbi:MAG: N-acetylmuramoyl-L-alanine amidase [Lachnospiraceae bacterium]|nr:N-acetylmuramoyl-L-alanine amidase [Lachnospiraceae bacterium]
MTSLKKTLTTLSKAVLFGLILTFTFSLKANAMTIVLDPGHGGPGTSGAGALYPPYMEKSLNLAVASQIKSELEAAGIKTYMTRTGDVSLDLQQRAAYAKSVNADLLISIHFNSSGSHAYTGSEVWTSLYGSYYTTGYSLGSNILQQLSGLGLQSKGVKTKLGNSGDYYGLIRYGVAQAVPSIIVEHCFMDNAYDRSILEANGPSGIGHATATGIINYVNSVGGAGATLPKSNPIALVEGATSGGSTAGTAVAPTVKANTGTASTASSKTTAAASVGFSKDAAGNTIFTDKNGNTGTFTPAEWNKLLGNWAYTGNAEYYIRQVPLGDLNAMVGK